MRKAMTNGELFDMLEEYAKEYVPQARESIWRSRHMNDLRRPPKVSQKTIEALIVDFINFVCAGQGGDLGFCTKHLKEKRGKDE